LRTNNFTYFGKFWKSAIFGKFSIPEYIQKSKESDAMFYFLYFWESILHELSNALSHMIFEPMVVEISLFEVERIFSICILHDILNRFIQISIFHSRPTPKITKKCIEEVALKIDL